MDAALAGQLQATLIRLYAILDRLQVAATFEERLCRLEADMARLQRVAG
jgi:hypothetical protein